MLWGGQPEFEESRLKAHARGLSSVELDLEAALGPEFAAKPWDARIPQAQIYENVRKSGNRIYTTSSAVELVRFVRNSFAHVSAKGRPNSIKEELLDKFVFLDKFPNLFITVYEAVRKSKWKGRRKEIKRVVEEL